jgi:hypothetical protein
MLKSNNVPEFTYWKRSGFCIVPLKTKEEYDNPEHKALRASGVVARFVVGWTPLRMFQELIQPSIFEEKDGHFVSPVRDTPKTLVWHFGHQSIRYKDNKLKIGKYELCGECFLLGGMKFVSQCVYHRRLKRKREYVYKPAVKPAVLKPKKFVCHFVRCDKKYSTLLRLQVHQCKHIGAKPYSCSLEGCKYKSADSSKVTRHERIHTKEMRHVCKFDNCEYKCKEADDMKKHVMYRHTLERPFVCDFEECDYKCATSSDLIKHHVVHTGEKPYVCNFEECEYKCAVASDITKHKRVHTGETPFVCNFEECDYKSGNASCLWVHKKRHNTEKPYVCTEPTCNYAGKTQGDLYGHKLSHNKVKRYKCNHCSFASTRVDCLRVHLLLHERQKNYKFECKMQDGGTQLYQPGDVQCMIRCDTQRDMDFHIERNHTVEGIGKKLQSETKLAEFFTSKGMPFDRDWVNRLSFKNCNNIEGKQSSARPDFFLPVESARLKAIVIVGNDEFCHRYTSCDLRRTWNIVQSLDQTEEHKDVPILYIRLNPHAYRRDGIYFNHSLASVHKLLLKTLKKIQSVKPGLNLVYIHYDRTDGQLDIFKANEDDDFGPILKDCVLLDV